MATRTQQTARASAGDLIEVSGRRIGDPGRSGEIVEVLGASEREHYLVRWDDGHTTILYPGEATRIRKHQQREPQPAPARPAAAAEELVELLREASVGFELLPHRRTTSAASEARALGVLPQVVAKTLVVRDADGSCIRAVVPATSRLDLAKLAGTVGATEVRLMSESDLVSAYPPFELGAVPPFGGPAGDRVVVDSALAEADHVIVEAGVHDTSLRLRAEDMLAITSAQVADIVV